MTIRDLLKIKDKLGRMIENDVMGVRYKDQIVYLSICTWNNNTDIQLSTDYYRIEWKKEGIDLEEILDLSIDEHWSLKDLFWRGEHAF
jgi:hypothetical protein